MNGWPFGTIEAAIPATQQIDVGPRQSSDGRNSRQHDRLIVPAQLARRLVEHDVTPACWPARTRSTKVLCACTNARCICDTKTCESLRGSPMMAVPFGVSQQVAAAWRREQLRRIVALKQKGMADWTIAIQAFEIQLR